MHNLHPGCKFASRVYFSPCERCFKNLHPKANLHPGANLLLLSRWSKFICTRMQVCTRVQIVHMNAKWVFSIVSIGDFDILQTFSVYDFVLTASFMCAICTRGANLHPGCKFAPGVYFWPCERCFKDLHPGANYAHERKLYNFYTL